MTPSQNFSTCLNSPSMVLREFFEDTSGAALYTSHHIQYPLSHSAGVPSPQQLSTTFKVFATPFTPGAQQHTATALNINQPEFVPSTCQWNNAHPRSTLNPAAEEFIS